MTTPDFNIDALLGLVNEEQLGFTEEQREGFNRARLIQGDVKFASDANFKNTVYYKGGIGLSVDNLPPEILEKAEAVLTPGDSGEWAVFPELDVVVLANARVRRFFMDIDGNKRLACGTNQDGQNAVGWKGTPCHQCEYFPKNWTAAGNDKKDACKGYVEAMIYIPSLDHAAILSMAGGSYMAGTDFLKQVSALSTAFARRPELKARNLARVNSYFFKTTLKAGPFKKSDSGDDFQSLEFSKVSAPYDWAAVCNTPDVIQRCAAILEDVKAHWETMYVNHNPNAVFALPSPDAQPVAQIASAPQPVAALTGGTKQVEVLPPETPADAQAPAVSAIALDDDDDDNIAF